MIINGFSRKIPLTDEKGCATQWMQIFGEQVRQLPTIIGTGSPEGVQESISGRLYLDQSTGSIYSKRYDEIAGNKANGWNVIAGGSGLTYGTSTVSFGATETNEAQLVVIGQTTITATTKVTATIGTTATASYTENDHKYLGSIGVSITTGAIVAGTGFTIYVRSYQKLKGDISINWVY